MAFTAANVSCVDNGVARSKTTGCRLEGQAGPGRRVVNAFWWTSVWHDEKLLVAGERGKQDEEDNPVRLLKEDQQDEYGSHQSNTGHTKLGFNFCFCFDFFF